MLRQVDPKKGIMISIHPETKNLVITEWTLPIETHATILAWGLDMVRAINERNRFWKWLLRIVMGRYAYRELVGLRDALNKSGWHTELDYNLEHVRYHKDKVKL